VTGLCLLGRADQTVRVALGEPMHAPAAADLRSRLSGLLAGGATTLVVDVSGVGRLAAVFEIEG
jgi:hypothetical protein